MELGIMPHGPKFIHVHPEIVEKVSNHDVWVSAESESQKYITNFLSLTRLRPKPKALVERLLKRVR